MGSNALRFITWNIDGISKKNLIVRVNGVCDIISAIDADVVFLQEVVKENDDILINRLDNYLHIHNKTDFEFPYYTKILLKRSTVHLDSFSVIEFDETMMMRNLLKAEIKFAGRELVLYNTHLESTGEASEIRCKQLLQTFNEINSVNKNKIILFGGDLNVRDKEISFIGNIPRDLKDVWISTGQRKECEYTWDRLRNDNLGSSNRYARYRFDRLYLRDSVPSTIKSEYFGLIGIERLIPHICFPSDHWGILASFDVQA